jgi:type IV pilus assembly protein PilW
MTMARAHPRSRMAGMSLMEILIAMAIGLIGIVVITQTYLVNENYKRSTASAGGAQTSGALALYTIERDARMVGWGIAWSSVLGCPGLRWYHAPDGYSVLAGGTLPTIVPAPVVISDGGAGLPDTITVLYGTGTERVIPATMIATMTSPGDAIQVDNPEGFSANPGDIILAVQNNLCSLMQVTSTASGQLAHVTGVNAAFNPPSGGSLPVYPSGAQVFNLGRPVVNVYSIDNPDRKHLQLWSLFTASSSTVVPNYAPAAFPIIENIVDLQAQYGKDNGVDNGTVANALFVANDGIVDSYDNVTPTDAVGWQQVLSVRIGVLARSEHYVKPVSGVCVATAAMPTWSGSAQAGSAFSVPGGIPSCYGYRVFETVVPLRNMIWRQG